MIAKSIHRNILLSYSCTLPGDSCVVIQPPGQFFQLPPLSGRLVSLEELTIISSKLVCLGSAAISPPSPRGEGRGLIIQWPSFSPVTWY